MHCVYILWEGVSVCHRTLKLPKVSYSGKPLCIFTTQNVHCWLSRCSSFDYKHTPFLLLNTLSTWLARLLRQLALHFSIPSNLISRTLLWDGRPQTRLRFPIGFVGINGDFRSVLCVIGHHDPSKKPQFCNSFSLLHIHIFYSRLENTDTLNFLQTTGTLNFSTNYRRSLVHQTRS